jgi:hypothetical protein
LIRAGSGIVRPFPRVHQRRSVTFRTAGENAVDTSGNPAAPSGTPRNDSSDANAFRSPLQFIRPGPPLFGGLAANPPIRGRRRSQPELWSGRPRVLHPIAAIDDGRGLVALPLRQPPLLPQTGPPQDGAQQLRGDHGDQSELALHLFPQRPDLPRNRGIGVLQPVFHPLQQADPRMAQHAHVARKPLADAAVGMVLVAHPAGEHGAADAEQARAVALESRSNACASERVDCSRETRRAGS